MLKFAAPKARRLYVVVAAMTMALATQTAAWAGSASDASSAETAAASAGCSAVALTPFTNNVNIVGRTSASCHGPVYSVVVTDDLYQLHVSWVIVDSRSTRWGTVPVSRYGYRDAWFNPGIGACYGYINRGRVTWKFASGSSGSSINYSPRANLRVSGGAC
jgi:hypothetical protein